MLLQPELLYRDGAFHAGPAIDVDERSGTIRDVIDSAEPPPGAERLDGVALLPGFVNAHSHAFQRLIRGRTQWRPAGAESADFWSWRAAMYDAALTLTPEEVGVVSRQCFLEMAHSGYTTVGEFHYLQRDAGGGRYADPLELARRVVAAAREVGLRIRLLNVCYARGGIGRELQDEQRRFATPDLDEYIHDTEALAVTGAADPLVSVGAAPHSIRAVPREWLRPLAEWATSREIPLHMHVAEQPAEVEATVEAWGVRPVQLLADEGVLGASFTAVHGTHVDGPEIALLAEAGATVCACPTTERDLGDGFLPARAMLDAGVRISLGSDSQTRIDPLEEMRLVEYHERLLTRRRVVLARRDDGDRLEVAPLLIEMATAAGAASLDAGAGEIDAGGVADLVGVDLHHPVLAGYSPQTLPALLALCAGPDVVRDVWVGGVRRVRDRRHVLDDEAAEAFEGVARRFGGPA